MSAIDKFGLLYNYVGPVIDVLVLTFLLYKAYQLINKTQSMQILKVLTIVFFAYGLALVLNLSTLLWILNTMAPGLLICFAIVFQPEMRKIFLKLGQGNWFKLGTKTKHTTVDSVLIAAEILSKQRRGMLVVFMRKTYLKDIMDTGTRLNADVSSSILVTIFGHDTPLHDGASIIQGGKILASGCFLPLSEQYDIKKTFGTRHRAALGLSEETDAVVLVVSEETGAISLCYDGKLHYDLSMEQTTRTLETLLEITPDSYTEEDPNDVTSKA
ncbi:MAG: diadenylate cyclase CdaA [Treponemataceae bacterium]|nr:diadenylate cyclase CdaA [Treponemataceae bacterium]